MDPDEVVAGPDGEDAAEEKPSDAADADADADPDANADGQTKKEAFTDEEKQDLWLDFAAERYEIVEQLPLELHRNFRLLRELDDGCICESLIRSLTRTACVWAESRTA